MSDEMEKGVRGEKFSDLAKFLALRGPNQHPDKIENLKKGELAYFTQHYASCDVVVLTQPEIKETGSKVDHKLEEHILSFPRHQQAAVRSIDSRVRERIGEQLHKVGVSPLTVYLTPVDVRQKAENAKAVTRRNKGMAGSSDPASTSYTPFWGSNGTPVQVVQ